MNKYHGLVAACLILSNTTYATPFYSGINLGINSVKVNTSTVPVDSASGPNFAYAPSYNGFHGQLYIGKFLFNPTPQMSLAFQGDADLFTGSAENTVTNWFSTTPASSTEKLKYGFGLFVLPHYQWAEGASFFAGPGWVLSQFTTSSGDTGGSLGTTGTSKEWLSGWSIKLGSVNRIKNNLDFLLTYQYNQYESSSNTAIEPLTGSLLAANYKPRANLFSIGLRYTTDTPTPSTGK
jgi:opacity protein-like surface antigen